MAESGHTLRWQLRLRAPVAEVFSLLTTDRGRETFWVERSIQRGDQLEFQYPGGAKLVCLVLEHKKNERFTITYFDGTRVSFTLCDANGGTHLTLEQRDLAAESAAENRAGWVSVLLALKAQADFGVDLRNHDSDRTWEQGYPDN